MTDHKFDREDRQIVLHDFKQRLIDLTENPYVLPDDVGIYDEPVRYFKANEQWCKIIFGWLHWLEGVAGWKDAQDPNFPGIQAILQFEEGIEPMSIDYDAMKEAFCEAIECGMEKVAARYLSGTAENLAGGDIVIPPGGTPTVIPPGQAPDDTTTTADEEARAGGATAILQGLNLILSQMNTWYTGGVTSIAAQGRLKSLYNLDEADADSFVSNYYTERAVPNPYPTSFAATLAEYMYCKGNTIQNLFRWNYDKQTTNLQYLTGLLFSAMTQNQLDIWFNQGELVPSTDYVEYACTKFETETIEFKQADGDLAGGAYKTGSVVNKNNHRVLLEASGKIIDTVNGGYQDFFWKVAADGTKSLIGTATTFGTAQVQTNWSWPTAAEVPFQASGIYKVTRENVASGATFLSIRRKMGSPEAGGKFTLKITDLGEILT